MSLTDDLARLIDEVTTETYDPTGSTSTVFLNELPAEPAHAVAVALYPGVAGNAKLALDEPRVQIAVRDEDARAAEAAAEAIYGALVGLTGRVLASGTRLLLVHPVQSGPVWMPVEERGRTRFVINLALFVQRPTLHRV